MSTYLAADEFEVTRALSIAISSPVLGTGLVGREFAHSSILVHGHEVKSAVEAAREVGEIDIKGELLVQEVEHLIVGIICH